MRDDTFQAYEGSGRDDGESCRARNVQLDRGPTSSQGIEKGDRRRDVKPGYVYPAELKEQLGRYRDNVPKHIWMYLLWSECHFPLATHCRVDFSLFSVDNLFTVNLDRNDRLYAISDMY